MALSAGQHGAKFLQMGFRVPVSVDAQRLKRAWDTVFAATYISRTQLIFSGLKTFQIVSHCTSIWIIDDDLLRHLAIDSMNPPRYGETLGRFTLIEQSPSDRLLVMSVHHALYDCWSMQLIFAQVSVAYHGQPLASQSPFKSFINYLFCSSLNSDAFKTFWENAVREISCPMFPQTPSRLRNLSSVQRPVTRFCSPLAEARNQNLSISSAIRAAWAMVVSKDTYSAEAVFGVTLSGRDVLVDGISTIVGPTITTAPF